MPYYLLKLFVVDSSLKRKYESVLEERNANAESKYPDAGFDLFCPNDVVAKAGETTKVNHIIQCSMSFVDDDNVETPVGYYLYPRSSTGTKTPLRLANSVGIMDSGYRGNVIAAFDNWKQDDYVIVEGDRVAQLCAPNMTFPIKSCIVDDIEELGVTERGEGGFGSTGV